MCPTDSTPDPRDMLRAPDQQDIPTARKSADDHVNPDISKRPSLPDHPQRMAADIEDDEADPVIDSGPGIADGALNRK